MVTRENKVSEYNYIDANGDNCLKNSCVGASEKKLSTEDLLRKYEKLKNINALLKQQIDTQEKKIRKFEALNKVKREFSRQAFVSFCCINAEGVIKEWNNSISIISGLNEEETLGKDVKNIFKRIILHEQHYKLLMSKTQDLIQKSSDSSLNYSLDTEIQNVNTKIKTSVRFFLQPIITPYNSFISIVLYDITKEKKQEADIARYNECIENILTSNTVNFIQQSNNYEEIGNNSPDLIVRIELLKDFGAFKIVYLNPVAKKFYNVSVDNNAVYKDLLQFLPGTYNVEDLNVFDEIKNGISFLTKQKDENKYWKTFVYSLVNNENHSYLLLISRDITHEYEKERLSFILRSSIDSLTSPYWVCNEKSEFVIQNKISKKYWGDIVGQVFDYDLISETARQSVKDGIANVLNGKPFSIQYKVQYPDSYRYVLLRISPMKTNSGEIKGFIGIIFDITERKDLERQLLKSVIETEERERKYFSQELHDSVNPLLSAAGLYIDWLEKPNKNLGQQEVIKDIRNLVKEANVSCREISHKLSPHFLENAGLEEAIQMYCNTLEKSDSIQFNLSFNMGSRIPKIKETVLYRVLCECITNTLKHASASLIQIAIKSDNKGITLNYSDDGKGFDMDIIHNQQKGMGILSIKNRIKYLNGTLAFNSSNGKGFQLEIKIRNQESF